MADRRNTQKRQKNDLEMETNKKVKIENIDEDVKPLDYVEELESRLLEEQEPSVYSCPFQDCNFVSNKKFLGVRSHLVKHFKKQIRCAALPKSVMNPCARSTSHMMGGRDMFQCMVGWNCCIDNLEARGELESHYGLMHCLVDLCFRQHIQSWLSSLSLFCPLHNQHFPDIFSFLEHLTFKHYYNLIFDDCLFSKKTMGRAEGYKCPHCVLRFTGKEDESYLTDLVRHCGIEHNFSMYYLYTAMRHEDRELTNVTARVKDEPVVNEELKIKEEPIEEAETATCNSDRIKDLAEVKTKSGSILHGEQNKGGQEQPTLTIKPSAALTKIKVEVLNFVNEDIDLSSLSEEQLENMFLERGLPKPLGGKKAMVSLLEKSKNPGYKLDVTEWNRRFIAKKEEMRARRQSEQALGKMVTSANLLLSSPLL